MHDFSVLSIMLYCYTYYDIPNMEQKMEATAQMNVRISPDLKKSGDDVLARNNISPSRAIRALYESLSAGDERAAEAIALIKGEDAQGHSADSPRGDDSAVQSFHDFAVDHYSSLNILGVASSDVDDDELLYDALMQRGSGERLP